MEYTRTVFGTEEFCGDFFHVVSVRNGSRGDFEKCEADLFSGEE